MLVLLSGLLCLLIISRNKVQRRFILASLAVCLIGIAAVSPSSFQHDQAWAVSKTKTTVKTKTGKKTKLQTAPQDPQLTASQSSAQLASLDYAGTQTIDVNQGVPTFTPADLATTNGAWEKYGDLDQLNRATSAEAMLNQRLMPTAKRKTIASVKPTGWHNKKIKGHYLYNRSHLIGYTLAGENANWKNLITGTRQLNSPEMLHFEMDIQYYLEKDPNHYVRYSVTPIFRGEELLARGVHLMAQSVNDDELKFNVYIFNVQDGVTLNYADGTSQILETATSSEKPAVPTSNSQPATPPAAASPAPAATEQQYVDAYGNGLIKGSRNGIYHLPGSQYYDRTTNPAAWFKTVSEAQQAGYRAPR